MALFEKTKAYFHTHFVPSQNNNYRPHSLRRDFLIGIVAFVCVVEGFLATSLSLQSKAPQFSAAVLESALISLTNEARASSNKGALIENPTLTLAAQAKANDMAQKGYFSHVGPDGSQPWVWMKDAGYEYAYAGENLAAHFFNSTDVVDAWLKSPGHRENILQQKYQEIGIGIAHGLYGGVDTIFVVQFFGVTKTALGISPVQKTSPTKVVVAPSADPNVADETSPTVVTAELKTESTAPEVAAEPSPVVAGRSTSEVPNRLSALLSSPSTVAMWLLFALLFVIAISVLLAFVVHIRMQPVDLLINGMVVAAFILCIIATNGYFFTSVDMGGTAASISAFEQQY